MEGRNSNNLKGIDVSNWQGNINFKSVKNEGIEVVYIKATEGDYFKDSYAKQNYERAKAEGLKVGFIISLSLIKKKKDKLTILLII